MSEETDRWERPWIETEADAIDEAAQAAFEMLMEDPDNADQETFEWSTEYQAENYNVENRLGDVRKETQEKASLVVPKSFLDCTQESDTDRGETA
ncbi:hypothetical protein [Natrialba taiwanensis]|uniref:Uncharacterized protein n=1 Tax=Natrialba taiwanensis DSM 12281 TaxID=1230458 RepID=L9ZY69_9EURY|nr:hypothetical protein [Natrialba taiwanensis]ELY91455.1 hypothetical protein C484_10521 [Natrialba taiwanensis DSM 12281]